MHASQEQISNLFLIRQRLVSNRLRDQLDLQQNIKKNSAPFPLILLSVCSLHIMHHEIFYKYSVIRTLYSASYKEMKKRVVCSSRSISPVQNVFSTVTFREPTFSSSHFLFCFVKPSSVMYITMRCISYVNAFKQSRLIRQTNAVDSYVEYFKMFSMETRLCY